MQAGEDHDRGGRGCERASRHDLRDRLHRSGDAGRRPHGRGHRPGVRAEHGCGRARSRARDKCRSELGSGVDVRRRPGTAQRARRRRTHEPKADPTRAPATRCGWRRAARVPVAARRLRRGRRRTAAVAARSTTSSTSRTGRSTSTRRSRSRPPASTVRRRSSSSRTKTGHQGQLLRGHQLERRSTSRRSRAALRRATAIGATSSSRRTTDRFLGELRLDNDWAQKLDKNLIPNISNLIDAQASPPLRPEPRLLAPVALGHGRDRAGTRTSPGRSRPSRSSSPTRSSRARSPCWNSMGDTLGLVMLENGDDPANVTDETFDRAIAVVQKAQDAGQIRRFYGNDYAQPLAKGDLAASMAWSGDIFLLNDPKLKWAMAKSGGIIWTDNMLIPLGGSVPTASTYMNFVYDPKIAAQLALGAGYISSVAGVKDEARSWIPTRRTTRSSSRRTTCSESSTRTTPRCSPTPTTRRSGSPCRANRANRLEAWGRSSIGTGAPRRICCWRPGIAVARDLLPDPARLPRLRVAAVRSLPELRVHLGVLELLGRDPRLPRAVPPLVRLRRHRDRRVSRPRVSRSSTGSRSGRVHGGISSCSSSSRRSSSPTSCGRSPGSTSSPTKARSSGSSATSTSSARTAGSWRRRSRSSRASPTTSSPSWRSRSTCRSSRSTRGCSRPRRTCTRRRRRRSSA